MKRPTFFISSTIYDFRDLRSALKFYLEEQGCRVLASEFNDFEKPLDKHSYDACLEAIKAADYFVLLIGSRVGGWYDEVNRISITRREYREAYELHRAGKLKLFCFVRAEVWQAKEDRRELKRYLKSVDIEEGYKSSIANHPSKSLADAEFISSFISEVGKNKETADSVKTGSDAPTGNWINVFSDYRDLIRVLDGSLFTSTPTEDLTLKRLLRRELREILLQALFKSSAGLVCSPLVFIEDFHHKTPITFEVMGSTRVNTKDWDLLAGLSANLFSKQQISPMILNQALIQPTFLTFNLETDSYQETEVYDALFKLQDEIKRFTKANTSETLNLIYECSRKAKPQRGTFIEIETIKLMNFLHLMDRWANVIELSQALLLHLDGAPYIQPKLRPSSPIQGLQLQLNKEMITNEELDNFLRS